MGFPRPQWMRQYPLVKQLARLRIAVPPSSSSLLRLSSAAVVGFVSGVGAILFRELTNGLTYFTTVIGKPFLVLPGMASGILIPTLGGVVIGLLVYRHAQETLGLGLDEVAESVRRPQGGRLRILSLLKRVTAAVICMGTGGSVGREEPIALLGATLGSAIGQQLHLPENGLRYLVASGVAGGIAVALHAPMAAVFFALEVVLTEFSMAAVSSTVIASVSACAIATMMGYSGPVIPVPDFALVSSWELPLYVVLGGLTAIVSLAFITIFYLVEILFAGLACPVDLKPMIGGLLIGTLGLYVPQILGGGYDTLTQVLQAPFPLGLMVLLIAIKILATSITLGSGGIGGALAPLLLIGAFLGGSFGSVVHHLWPALTAAPSAYALVGMAVVFATTIAAPLTAVLLAVELTGDAHILMPLLLTTTISLLIAQYARDTPLYVMTLWRRHIRQGSDHAHGFISHLQVAQVMTTQVATVPTTMALAELARAFVHSGSQALLVVDPHGAFYGLLSLSDFKQALICDAMDGPTAGDIAATTVARVYPDAFISVAIHDMASSDLWCLPVVDRSQAPRLLGVVYREDLNRVCREYWMRTGHHVENG